MMRAPGIILIFRKGVRPDNSEHQIDYADCVYDISNIPSATAKEK